MEWIEKLDGNVIVCDADATVIYMNEKAIQNYSKDGGAALIGMNLMDCHSERSCEKIREIMTTHQKNVYTRNLYNVDNHLFHQIMVVLLYLKIGRH